MASSSRQQQHQHAACRRSLAHRVTGVSLLQLRTVRLVREYWTSHTRLNTSKSLIRAHGAPSRAALAPSIPHPATLTHPCPCLCPRVCPAVIPPATTQDIPHAGTVTSAPPPWRTPPATPASAPAKPLARHRLPAAGTKLRPGSKRQLLQAAHNSAATQTRPKGLEPNPADGVVTPKHPGHEAAAWPKQQQQQQPTNTAGRCGQHNLDVFLRELPAFLAAACFAPGFVTVL